MNKETAEALEASIEKWDKNTRVQGVENYLVESGDCPLCGMFQGDWNCIGCPVNIKSVPNLLCADTPYMAAQDARDDWQDENEDTKIVRRAAHKAAREERDFLISLRDTS